MKNLTEEYNKWEEEFLKENGDNNNYDLIIPDPEYAFQAGWDECKKQLIKQLKDNILYIDQVDYDGSVFKMEYIKKNIIDEIESEF